MLKIEENTNLAPYTIYKIGGPARYFIEITNSEELQEALLFSLEKKIPFFVIGAGSNILVSDDGFQGLIIKAKDGELSVEGEQIKIGAGVMMARAVMESAKAGLSGFEWGIGVPGTVGGSVRGNAGCFGGEMKDVVDKVLVLSVHRGHSEHIRGVYTEHIRYAQCKLREESQDKLREESQDPSVASLLQDDDGVTTFELTNKECEFLYRDSIFKKHPGWVILSATLKLKKDNPEEIKEKIKQITLERTSKQDIGSKTCGCIFKNISWSSVGGREEFLNNFPEAEKIKDRPNIPASFLIDQAGLKGKRFGQVVISPKHANFFVNEGGATAGEVRELIKIAKDEVRRKFGAELEEEIQYVGFKGFVQNDR